MWPVWPERKQEGGDDITQDNVMMNDDGDDCGDVDGDKCCSKVFPLQEVCSTAGAWATVRIVTCHRTTVPP